MGKRLSRFIGLTLSVFGVVSFLNGGGVITGAVVGSQAVSGNIWYGLGSFLFLAGLLVVLFGD